MKHAKTEKKGKKLKLCKKTTAIVKIVPRSSNLENQT